MPFLATGFGAFLMRQAFLTLPRELRDAAALDGYGHWRFMTRVAVPLARPAVAALSVFAFLGAWNQYLWPLLVTKDDEYRTVQIGLKQLQGLSIDQINVTFAGAIIAVLPLVILLLVFQKQLVRGPDRRCGQGMSHDAGRRTTHDERGAGMKRTAGVLLAAMVAVSGLVATRGRHRRRRERRRVTCPLAALKKASKPVEITMWHSMPRENETTLQTLTDTFNSSQSDVHVKLVNQVSYDDTFTKYKAGLSSGELPDLVQLQETEQQQMIDTQSIVPSGVCAKADKYSFSDYLPRVVSYFTVDGEMYAMPFNTSGPVLYYNKKAFTAAGLDPNEAAGHARRGAIGGREVEVDAARSAARRSGLKVEPGFVEHWLGLSSQLFVNNKNGRTGRTTASVLNSSTGKQIFSWLSGMVKDGLAATNPSDGQRQVRRPARHRQRQLRDGDRHERVVGHHLHACSRRASTPTSSSASRRCRGSSPARAACW